MSSLFIWSRLWIWKFFSLLLCASKEKFTKYRYKGSKKQEKSYWRSCNTLAFCWKNICWMSKQVIEASRKHIKTIKKSKLESKRNCVWNFPGKGSWSFSNCWLKPMVHCMFIWQKHWKMDDEIKYRWASILLRSGHELQ